MSDFADRAEWERKLARALEGVGREYVATLMDALGDPPQPSRITPDFWIQFGAAMGRVLQPTFEAVYLEMAKQTLAGSPIGVDWTVINAQAAQWAGGYTFALIADLTANTRDRLQASIAGFFNQPVPIGQVAAEIDVPALRDAIGRIIMPDTRAAMIAQTEITRAADLGQAAVVASIKADNPAVQMIEIWETNNDEIVQECPICWPRHGKKRGDGWQDPPPAHPRCRCRRRYVMVVPGKKGGTEL